MSNIAVVDLFAGPGGLAEGFSEYRDGSGRRPFDVVLSVEKEVSAHRTLQLRSFLRQFDGDLPPEYYSFLAGEGCEPDWATEYPEEWRAASEEALRAELGTREGNAQVESRLAQLSAGSQSIVIGGPPCQAYSIVGRARNRGKADYVPEHDERHFLYEEYIAILRRLSPQAFVMENVKGMLSSTVEGSRIFGRVLADLRGAGGRPDSYSLFAVGKDARGAMRLQPADRHDDYLLRAEDFGVPQARHRVIIVGVRRDVAWKVEAAGSAGGGPPRASIRHVLEGMTALRSSLTRDDSGARWRLVVGQQMQRVCRALNEDSEADPRVCDAAESALAAFSSLGDAPPRISCSRSGLADDCPKGLRSWLSDPLLAATANHETRRHMDDDLGRYFYCAVFAQVHGHSPKSREFPRILAPAHANWTTGAFADRFRSQLWDMPGSTVTSHLHKDGHFFIHPDPLQCRSLTVREAARLQTFPDNYVFLGNRTQQYVQVGNAVPPFLARQLAGALWRVLQVEKPVSRPQQAGQIVAAEEPSRRSAAA